MGRSVDTAVLRVYAFYATIYCTWQSICSYQGNNARKVISEMYTCIYSWLQIPPRENWFQYVRRVYATAINFPCIITLALTNFSCCTLYTVQCKVKVYTTVKGVTKENWIEGGGDRVSVHFAVNKGSRSNVNKHELVNGKSSFSIKYKVILPPPLLYKYSSCASNCVRSYSIV